MKKFLKKLSSSNLAPLFYLLYSFITTIEYAFFDMLWALKGYKKPSKADVDFVCENVTFMLKSFERQRMAKGICNSIHRFYPGAKIIVADDSKKPLTINDDRVEIVRLPFNSGLSAGLNRALERVETPYLMRLDDDELLTRRSDIAGQLHFLEEHREVDLVGFAIMTAPKCNSPEEMIKPYYEKSYRKKELLLPRNTKIDDEHIVVAKSANIFLAKTDRIREIGWDDNIRMIDHSEFFYRCAGRLVCVIAPKTVVFHRHNPFNQNYNKYRDDWQGDSEYIKRKHNIK